MVCARRHQPLPRFPFLPLVPHLPAFDIAGMRGPGDCDTIAPMMLGIVLRLVCSAAAVWLSTLIISGIHVNAKSNWGTVGTVLLVALIIGVVNTVIKPIVKFIGCGLYVLTLGLIALVVNGLLFSLVSWICGELGIPFHVDNFWPSAVLGALIVSAVAWALGLFVKDRGEQ
jgi:putative membrane protein